MQFSPDGKKMFVSVGSVSNIDDSDTIAAMKRIAPTFWNSIPMARACQFTLTAFAIPAAASSSTRKTASFGFPPMSATVSATISSPITSPTLRQADSMAGPGGTWADIRIRATSASILNCRDKVITPDVLLQPHNASLQLTIYDGKQFPARNMMETFSPPSMVPGTRRFAWDMK